MRVLVTGHTGLVGGAVAERLTGSGHEVVGASRHDGVRIDLMRPDLLVGALEGAGPFDAVVHSAAALDQRPEAIGTTIANCAGTHAVVCAAERWECPLVFISSIGVVGTPQRLPIDEEHRVLPTNPYLAAKIHGEHIVAGAVQRGLAAASLRITAPIGAAMPRERVLGAFITHALAGEPLLLTGQGTRRQDFVDVRDIARAVDRWLHRSPPGCFNIGSGRSIANMALAGLVVATVDSSSSVRFADLPDPADRQHWDVSIERAREVFGYRPAISLEESIREIAGAWTG